MPFSKFMEMVENQRIFLSSVAALGSFDLFEGTLPFLNSMNERGLFEALDHLVNHALPSAFGVGDRPHPKSVPAPRVFNSLFGATPIVPPVTLDQVLTAQARWVDVQCWHGNARESMAMWKVYGGGEPSVAITSSPARLVDAVSAGSETEIYIAPVVYLNYRESHFETSDPKAPFLHKFDAFEYEREVRLIAYDPLQNPTLERHATGRHLPCDLRELVAGVTVSPTAPPWFLDLVDAIAWRSFGFGAKRSEIAPDV